MKTLPLLLIACLTGAVLLAGCAGDDDRAESTNESSGRELNTDVAVEGGDGSTADANATNETETNETTP